MQVNNRLFEIIYILMQKKKITAKELADKFEVSTRTIYRDIEILSGANIPIYASKGKDGGIGLLDEYVLNKIMELINDESILRKVIDNINKNKSTKLKPILEQLEQINKEIEKLTSKKSKNIELYEDGILDKNELSTRVKAINDEIEKLKYREQELKQDLQLAEGDPIPFEVVNEVMQRFKEVFLEMSTSQQRKQLILLTSRLIII